MIVIADFWKFVFVSSSNGSCMIFWMPFFPSMHGTPIDMFVWSYSPCRSVVVLSRRFLSFSTASVIMAIAAAGAYVVEPFSCITSDPDVRVCSVILVICCLVSSCVIGMPDTLA